LFFERQENEQNMVCDQRWHHSLGCEFV